MIGMIDVENSSWAKSLFQRMGYSKIKATTAKLELPPGTRKEVELVFYHQIVEKIEKHNIPESLTLNFDQTPSKNVPVSTTTLAKRNSKQVRIKGPDNKKVITATFTITLDGNFLGMQLIYRGKTVQSLPRFKFPQEFSLSINMKHYSNKAESIKLIEEIILPYVKEERKRLSKPDQAALVIFNVFRGRITDDVLNLLKENNIKAVFVPADMINLLHPLDLTVNGYSKKKFNHWYMEQITEQLRRQWKTNRRSRFQVTVDQTEAFARRMAGGALQSYDYQSR